MEGYFQPDFQRGDARGSQPTGLPASRRDVRRPDLMMLMDRADSPGLPGTSPSRADRTMRRVHRRGSTARGGGVRGGNHESLRRSRPQAERTGGLRGASLDVRFGAGGPPLWLVCGPGAVFNNILCMRLSRQALLPTGVGRNYLRAVAS